MRLPTKKLQDVEGAAWRLNPEAGGGQTEEAFGDLFLSLSQQPKQGRGPRSLKDMVCRKTQGVLRVYLKELGK